MVHLIVHLQARPGKLEALRAYERKALGIWRRHGGEVVAAFEPSPAAEGSPDEIQILRIADRERFEAFMQDPDRKAMAAERDAAIGKTVVIQSGKEIGY